MKTKLFLLLFLFASGSILNSQTKEVDSSNIPSKAKVKKGFSFGAIPIFAFDSDVGLKYGALANFYLYGNGNRYPMYNHSLFVRWYQTTKGSSISEIKYDSDRLIPSLRISIGASYQTEKALNFYGFNGYKALYNPDFENQNHSDYISRVFYRHERKVIRFNTDFQGNLVKGKLKWLAGISYHDSKIGSVDIEKLNKGLNNEESLPNVEGLYDLYRSWGVLPEYEIDGGANCVIKTGLVYNSCDNEADPNEGIWSEALISYGPKFFGFSSSVISVSLLHRHYINLFPDRIKLAYRLGYQAKISGQIPFYLLPYFIDSRNAVDAFGGAKTLRGILRNRVVGNGVAFGNMELRWKAFQTVVAKQNFYITLSAFLDGGRVVDPYPLNLENVPAQYLNWFNYEQENWHMSYGGGIHFVLNQNFIVAVDYGMSIKEKDGTNGIYIGMDFLF